MRWFPSWRREPSGALIFLPPEQRAQGTGERKRKHYSGVFRAITPLIKGRDVVCAACGEPERIIMNAAGKAMPTLIVHHIDENSENNAPENLVTLCAECHNSHHKSVKTPYPFLPDLAKARTLAMPAKWHERYAAALAKGEDGDT